MKTINQKSQREKFIFNYFSPHTALELVDIYHWLSPEITICESSQLPWGGQYRGLKGVGEFMSNVLDHVTYEIRLEEVYSCGEKVVAIGRTKGNVRSSGAPFDIRLTQLFTFDQFNKISKVEFLADLAAFLEILNQMKVPQPGQVV